MPSLCAVTSRRSFLALLWSVVVSLSTLGYLITLGITLQTKFSYNMYYNYNQNNDNENNNNNNQDENQWNNENSSVSVASRAMLFSYVWTGMSAVALGFAGTMVLGVLTPGGTHYTCFPSKVVQTSPTMIGAFIGSLIMFANLLFICAILFGQFNIRDFSYGDEEEERGGKEMQWLNSYAIQKSSTAFSFLCLFLAIMYSGFAVTLYSSQEELMTEIVNDAKAEALEPSPGINNHMSLHPSGNYVGGMA